VAQTTIAASYGLKQIAWMTAVRPMRWNDYNGGPPSDLVNIEVNLGIGTRYLRSLYDEFVSDNPGSSYDVRWRTALVWYNMGQKDPVTGAPHTPESSDYDDSVLSHVPVCMPISQQ